TFRTSRGPTPPMPRSVSDARALSFRATMRCSSCGNDNREGRKFCAGCGAALTLACAACGTSNQPGERFCGECGKQLAGAAKESTQRDPRAYTPHHLAEKILTTRSALEGERKQ